MLYHRVRIVQEGRYTNTTNSRHGWLSSFREGWGDVFVWTTSCDLTACDSQVNDDMTRSRSKRSLARCPSNRGDTTLNWKSFVSSWRCWYHRHPNWSTVQRLWEILLRYRRPYFTEIYSLSTYVSVTSIDSSSERMDERSLMYFSARSKVRIRATKRRQKSGIRSAV